jgi:predicted nucleotidyltransferase
VARSVWVEVSGVRVPLPRPEDLIILKAVAHRPQDLVDIEAILAAQPRLNLRRVRRWVREFSVIWKRYSLKVANGENRAAEGLGRKISR